MMDSETAESFTKIPAEFLKVKQTLNVEFIYEVLAKHYPDVAAKRPKLFKAYAERFTEQLHQGIEEEASRFNTDALERKRQSLMEMHNEQLNPLCTDNSDAWRPTGRPEEDVKAHLIPSWMKHVKHLKSKLEMVENENRQLLRRRVQAEKESDRLMAQIDGLVSTMEEKTSQVERHLSSDRDLVLDLLAVANGPSDQQVSAIDVSH